jgi:ADP-heptose:LPS heptosyltransferase
VDFQGLLRTALLARATGCADRFGMANAREGAAWLYSHKVVQPPQSIHLVDYYLRIVQEMGASDVRAEFVLPRNRDACEAVKGLLAGQGVGPDGYVVMVPASSDRDKCWPVERFGAVADRITADFGLSVVACGTTGESPTIQDFQRASRTRVVNLAGRTPLPELVALLRHARLVISNDTGPGHIAAALGTPLVMLFSWSNPARISPYGRLECMVARDPYGRGTGIRSRNPEHLVRNITVDEVYEKVRQQLATTKVKP